MGNSQAHPAFRTIDLTVAVKLAQDLIAIGDSSDVEVNLEITVPGMPELERLTTAMPTATMFGYGQSPCTHPPSGSAAASPFPIFLEWRSQPYGRLEDRFVAVVGQCPGTLVWSRVRWPAVPSLNLPAEGEYGHVSISINSRHLHWDEPALDHTVHIHDRKGSVLRAQWIAEQVGLDLIGPPCVAL
ncbi:hypothetical protein AB0M25_23605 [Streptomyces griseomycini]|uniref:hypothetical protein n=1 Tax=Streptomyces griseomycini TaxID=66895 RepID=UPI0034327DA9